MEKLSTGVLVVSDIHGDYYIRIKKLVYIEAERSYCKLHYINDEGQMTCKEACRPMAHYVQQCGNRLVHVHRNLAVNFRYAVFLGRDRSLRISGLDKPLQLSQQGYTDLRKRLNSK